MIRTAIHAVIPARYASAATVLRMGVNASRVPRNSRCASSPRTNVQNARAFSKTANNAIKLNAWSVSTDILSLQTAASLVKMNTGMAA